MTLARHTVLIAGGGAAAIEAALELTATASKRLDIEVIAAETTWSYRPLTVLEPFAGARPRNYAIDALEARGLRIHADSLASVDPDHRMVELASGTTLHYDALLLATGAELRSTPPRTISTLDTERLHDLVEDVEGGSCRRIAFIAPDDAAWTLPLYELVLQLAERVEDRCLADVELTVMTSERRPLEAFGTAASTLLERLLDDARVMVVTGACPDVPRTGEIISRPGAAALRVDRIVSLPTPAGRPIRGIPSTARGFVPVDDHGRVRGIEHVYAAGDLTDRPLKQGGLAAQQADAAAAAIAADLGLPVDAAPFRPVLRGILIAGASCWHFRRTLADDPEGTVSPRWWPPTKMAGRHLTPFLDGLDTATGQHQAERRLSPAGAGSARRRAVIARAQVGGHARTVALSD